MFAVTVDAVTMDTRRAVQGGTATSPESAMASEVFDQFVSAGTFKAVLSTYRHLCEVLRLKPTNFPNFYPRLKSKLHSWKAASLWTKLDKRASHKCYNRGKACPNTRVLIIGAGPCGLRTAIEAQLLGAKVVVIEKRDRFSRNNVLHLWPFVIHDLRNLGAKKFFGKFCAGSIDHISIRQLQLILLKVALLLGVEVHENVTFKGLLEPPEDQLHERIGWRTSILPSDHPVTQYEFDVLIGADGKRNTLLGFNRKEFRGKLAIAVTANFINRHTLEEARVPEISGVAFIFNQKFFQDMREKTGIDLENIVYYKDDTHYFVMTAKKQSLLDRGVILNDYNDTARLLAPENVDREALMDYARDAADFATNYQLPTLDFAVNHYGQADVAMFDFTSMYAAENACRLLEKNGHRLLQGLVGDSLLEPFWPTGSGCARGFLSSFDAAWMIRSWASGKMTPLQVLAEREAIYRLLAQTTPENLSKDLNQYTLNPSTRFPNLNLQAVLPSQVRSLYNTDAEIEDNLPDVVEVPRKRRRRESIIHPDALLSWCQRQVALIDDLKIENMTTSWKNGMALCAILHRYRPDLIDFISLKDEDMAKNNQLAFDICEREFGIPPVMTGHEMAECEVPDKLTMVAYISQIYEIFRGEIPYVVRPSKVGANEDLVQFPVQQSHTPLSILNKISQKLHNKRKYSLERETSKSTKEKDKSDALKKSRTPSNTLNRRRPREKDKAVALDLECTGVTLTNFQNILGGNSGESVTSRARELEEKLKKNAGLRCHLLEDLSDVAPVGRLDEWTLRELQSQIENNTNNTAEKVTHGMKVGKLRKDEWNVKLLEEKIKQQQKSPKTPNEERPKVMKEIFDDKLQLMDARLRAQGGLTPEEQVKFKEFDDNLRKLSQKVKEGSSLNVGVRGSNQVTSMTEHMTNIWNKKHRVLPPPPVVSTSQPTISTPSGGSEICYFCQKRVYLMERLSAEGLFFHRSCFRCEYCGNSLHLGNYAFDRTAVCGGKFYCRPHFRMQKPDHRWQEMMKRKHAFLSGELDAKEKEKMYTTLLANVTAQTERPSLLNDPLTKIKLDMPLGNIPETPSNTVVTTDGTFKPPVKIIQSLLIEPLNNVLGRDQTPERVEYENSILELSEEELLTSELEEEELTQKNFGGCQELATSDDEFSDLSTDTESDEEAFAEELERSLTADETRKLAETWQRKYSQDRSILDQSSGSLSADDEGSETEIGSEDGTSEDIDSDEEYSSSETGEENALPCKNEDTKSSTETKDSVMVEVPVLDLKGINEKNEDESSESLSDDFLESGEDSETETEVESSESEACLPPPQIPTIVIEESPPQEIPDEDWEEELVPATAGDNKSSIEADSVKDGKCSAIRENHSLDKFVETNSDLGNEHKENEDSDLNIYPSFTDLKADMIEESEYSKTEASEQPNVTDVKESYTKVNIFEPTLEYDKNKGNVLMFKNTSVTQENEIDKHNQITSNISSLRTLDNLVDKSSENICHTCNIKKSEEIKNFSSEIVGNSLQTAKVALPNQMEETDFNSLSFLTNEMVHEICSDSSPGSDDVSSISTSIGWNQLKSIKSSEESEISLVECLVSPKEESTVITAVKTNSINQESPMINEIFNNSNKVTSELAESENEFSFPDLNNCYGSKSSTNEDPLLNVKTSPNQSHKSDLSPQGAESSYLLESSFQCVNNQENTEQIASSTDNLNSFSIISTIPNENDTLPEPEIVPNEHAASNKNASIGSIDLNFNSEFITTRKQSQKHHPNDFNWSSDESYFIPWNDSDQLIKIDSPRNVPEDGIYRATLVQSEDIEENVKFHKKNTLSPPPDTESENCKFQSKPVLESEHSALNCSVQDKNITKRNRTELSAAQSYSFIINPESYDEEDNKLQTHDYALYPNISNSPDILSQLPPVLSTYQQSLLKDSKFDKRFNESIVKDCFLHVKQSEQSSLHDMETEQLIESRPKLETKFQGYSGSFAEKVRPRSLIGDSIYLRSLDINLQKMQFPSLSKSTEKIDAAGIDPKTKKEVNVEEEHSKEVMEVSVSKSSDPFPNKILNDKNLDVEQVNIPKINVNKSLKSKHSLCNKAASEGSLNEVCLRSKSDSTKVHKRELRKSVHEDIQGLPFADDEKHSSGGETSTASEDVFTNPLNEISPSECKIVYPLSVVIHTPIHAHHKEFLHTQESQYIRVQRTAEQERARKEARERARLKSDEELGLSPYTYRKKYHRQLSMNSIQYEELNVEDLFNKDEEDLDDDIIDGTFHAKRVDIIETNKNVPQIEISQDIKKPSPQSSEEGSSKSHPSITSPSLGIIYHNDISDKNTPTTSSSASKTDAANYLESSLSVDDIDVNIPLVSKQLFTNPPVAQINQTSSSETSPEIQGLDSFSGLKLKNKLKGKFVQHIENYDKSRTNGKKSFFSLLNFGKNNNHKDKLKGRCKDIDKERSSSLPADLSAKTPPKHRTFPHLKLSRSRERSREKQKKKYLMTDNHDDERSGNISSESIPDFNQDEQKAYSPLCIHSKNNLEFPKSKIELSSSVPSCLVIPPRVENGIAPKASEDSFSDTEDDTHGSKAQGNTIAEKKEKTSDEKEKKAQRVVQRLQRQQELKRLRTAQEIQRRLEELEVQQRDLEHQGVEVEKVLRGEDEGEHHSKGESELMHEWFTLVHAKNKLIREEQELLIRAKDLQLEDRHSRLQQEMRERMAKSDLHKSPEEIEKERKMLQEMLDIVEKRDELVAMVDQLRIREEEEDRDLESRMLAKGVQLSPIDKR